MATLQDRVSLKLNTFAVAVVVVYYCVVTADNSVSNQHNHRHHKTRIQHVPWAEHHSVEELTTENWGYKFDAW
jgi:hypothetical protein